MSIEREAYEGKGGWNDGRLGQAYDLVFKVLKENDLALTDFILAAIEKLDESLATQVQA